jgi:putative transposase
VRGFVKSFFIEILLIISNTVHHGLVNAPKDWQYSSFHRYVEEGIYDQMWGASEKLIFDSDIGME